MARRRTLFAAAASALALVCPGAAAQDHGPQHTACRIEYFAATTAGDEWTELGTVELGPHMRTGDGFFMINGSGTVEISTMSFDQCRVVGNQNYTARVRAMVTSIGANQVQVDIIPIDFSYPLTFQCGPDRMEYDAVVTVPETVTLAYEDNAVASHSQDDGRTQWEATVQLKFCDRAVTEH